MWSVFNYEGYQKVLSCEDFESHNNHNNNTLIITSFGKFSGKILNTEHQQNTNDIDIASN